MQDNNNFFVALIHVALEMMRKQYCTRNIEIFGPLEGESPHRFLGAQKPKLN